MEGNSMPTNPETAVKLLDAKIKIIFDLLKVHSPEEALCILVNVKIQLETFEVLQLDHAEASKKVEALETEAAMPV